MGKKSDIGAGIMAIEYERKFAAAPEQLEAVRNTLDATWTEYRMQTTYYDAPDGSLSRQKWMLRHRLENSTHVCTLKTPAGDARGEWEVAAERIEDAIPELCKLMGSDELLQLTARGVQPICGAAFTRLAAVVTVEGAVVEVALDEGILFAEARQMPLCELEVELKSGSRQGADAFAEALVRRYGLVELKDSKFKRARSLLAR